MDDMTDEGDPTDRAERARALRAIDWGKVFKKLTAQARRWGASESRAEDLAQYAMTRMLKDGGALWDYKADPTAFLYLLRVLHERRKTLQEQAARREELMPTETSTEKVEEFAPESDRTDEGAFVRREAALRNIERLRASLADSPLALEIVELCIREGQLDPKVIAERLGVAVKDVYTAQAQIRRHVTRLREDGSDPQIQVAGAAKTEEAT
jgi:DNA-directed RNA polymerase specialized sigma24 family protein